MFEAILLVLLSTPPACGFLHLLMEYLWGIHIPMTLFLWAFYVGGTALFIAVFNKYA